MSKPLGELKDAQDRGVQVRLTNDGTLQISGPEGVVSLKRKGVDALVSMLDHAAGSEEIADETPVEKTANEAEPTGNEGKGDEQPHGASSTKSTGEKKGKQK
jgi:hypothetical protein